MQGEAGETERLPIGLGATVDGVSHRKSEISHRAMMASGEKYGRDHRHQLSTRGKARGSARGLRAQMA